MLFYTFYMTLNPLNSTLGFKEEEFRLSKIKNDPKNIQFCILIVVQQSTHDKMTENYTHNI